MNKVKSGYKSDQHLTGGPGYADFPAPGGAGGNGEDLAQILNQKDDFVT